MSARDEAVEMIRRICPAHLSADEYGRILAEKFAAHRAEVLREAATAVRADVQHIPYASATDYADRHAALLEQMAAVGQSSREARLTETLHLIRSLGGRWTAGRLHDHRRQHSGPTQRGTARRDLADLTQRGHLTQHGPQDGRYYLPTNQTTGES